MRVPQAKLAFIDIETTGLDPERHEMFEFAAKVRDPHYTFTEPRSRNFGQTEEGKRQAEREKEEIKRKRAAWDYTRDRSSWLWPQNLGQADSGALRLNHYLERRDRWTGHKTRQPKDQTTYGPKDFYSWSCDTAVLLQDAYLVGCQVHFDAKFLEAFMRRNGAAPNWHHRLVDVESMAMGLLRLSQPAGLTELAGKLEIDVDKKDRHTAMGDVSLTMAVYDKLRGIARGDES